MARTNVLTTAKRIRRQLSSAHRQEEGVLFADINDSATTVQFDTTLLPAVRAGTLIGIDLELMRVRSKDDANNTVSVTRGYLDSTAVAHTAGAQIDISPRFSLLDIFDSMQSEIDSWGQQLYYTVSDTFAVPTTSTTLELPLAWASLLGVCELLQNEVSNDSNVAWPRVDAKLIRGKAGEFDGAATSGILLRFLEPIRTGSVYVVAALPFDATALAVTSDLVTDFHLEPALLDVLELGVKRRCTVDSDNNRGARQAQDESRMAQEVPYGSMVSLTQLGMAQYMRRKSEHVSLLHRRYPLRIT
jgi:hypothetical protein